MDYLENFRNYLSSERNAAENTVAAYIRDVKQFLSYLEKRNLTLEDTNTEVLQRYRDFLYRQGKSAATAARSLTAVRTYFRFLRNAGIIPSDPSQGVKAEPIDRRSLRVLTSKEIDKFFSLPDENTVKGIRDKAILEVLYATGIKTSELIHLNVQDVDLTTAFLRCRSKGQVRYIPLYEKAVSALRRYMDHARGELLGTKKEETLFLNCSGSPISRQGVCKILRTYQEKAGIKKSVTPNILRNTFATQMLQNGADVKSVQFMLGHSHLTTTQGYVKMIGKDIKKVYKNSHPRAK